MSPTTLTILILLTTTRALVLGILSRLLFEWVLRTALLSRRSGGCLAQILRLPGNMIHEFSHAIGYILSGYKVKQVILAFQDSQGRGRCSPGDPWAPWAIPWLATAFAALMPTVIGVLVLYYLSGLLGIDITIPVQETHESAFLSVFDAWRETLRNLDFQRWQTWLFIYLGMSIGAELAPSDIDIKLSAPVILLLGGIMIATVWAFGTGHPDAALWLEGSDLLAHFLKMAIYYLDLGILLVAVALTITLPISLIFRFLHHCNT